MYEHPLKSNFAQAPRITLWFCLLLGLGLSACERDVVTGNIQFSWVSNGTGDFRQGVGNGSSIQIEFTTH